MSLHRRQEPARFLPAIGHSAAPPGVYEALREDLNNAVLAALEAEREDEDEDEDE